MTPLEILAAKLPSPDISDTQRLIAIAEAEQEIKNYCNIEIIPEALYFTLANMAADLLAFKPAAGETDGAVAGVSGTIASIKEGDTTVSFGSSAQARSQERAEERTEKLLLDYRKQLQSFRKVRW